MLSLRLLSWIVWGLPWSGNPATAPCARLELNQHLIEGAWQASSSFEPEQCKRVLASRLSHSGHRWACWSSQPPSSLEDEEAVLCFLLDHVPPYSIVYPTERYYYYRFQQLGRTIGGNIRLTDVEEGEVHIGYFELGAGRDASFAASFGPSDGMHVSRVGEDAYLLAYRGRERVFELATEALAVSGELQLLEDERAVSGILDESGIPFTLLYNQSHGAFYYVLDEGVEHVERLVALGLGFSIGERTGFVFYEDPEYGRKLLVGVQWNNVYENNYFDGPFDQVPPRLDIKEELEAFYPYVRAGEGIDAHGNFLGRQHVRVAITPYQSYLGVVDLVQHLDERRRKSTTRSELWSELTRDFKRSFHEHMGAGGLHATPVSRGWPANHDGRSSLQWPGDHAASLSTTWDPDPSGGAAGGARD